MDRKFYLDLAQRGMRLPIATHLVLHKKADHEVIIHNGARLGGVMIEAARFYKSPLAIPLMDLALEKEALLAILGVPAEAREKFHFNARPERGALEKVQTAPFMIPRMNATCDAVRHVAGLEEQAGVVSLGMGIGPFSLMTKLLSDPITPVFLAAPV